MQHEALNNPDILMRLGIPQLIAYHRMLMNMKEKKIF